MFEEAGPKLDVEDLNFELSHAMQGQEALAKVKQALAEESHPYAVVLSMSACRPAGTVSKRSRSSGLSILRIEIVLCTAYSDFAWEEIRQRLRHPDRLLILRKPFDAIEVLQLAYCLTKKWFLRRQASCRMQDLEIMVEERMKELEKARLSLKQATRQQGR